MWFITTNAYRSIAKQCSYQCPLVCYIRPTGCESQERSCEDPSLNPQSRPQHHGQAIQRYIYSIGIEGYITSPLSLPCMYMHVHVLTLHVTYILGFSHKINFLKINSHVISSHEINFHEINKALQNSCQVQIDTMNLSLSNSTLMDVLNVTEESSSCNSTPIDVLSAGDRLRLQQEEKATSRLQCWCQREQKRNRAD